MPTITMNAEIIANGPVYANGPVFVQGVDVKKALDELNSKLLEIKEEDLKVIKQNIDKLLAEFQISGQTKSNLEKLRNWIETGKNLTEIIKFIQQTWIELGPIITNILLDKKS